MIQTVSITSKGQMTIPKAIREELGLQAPGKATIARGKDGSLVIGPPKTIADIRRQLAASRGKGEPLTEREKLIGPYLAKKYGVR